MSRVGIIFTGKYTYFITHTNLLPSFFIIMHKIPLYGDETVSYTHLTLPTTPYV